MYKLRRSPRLSQNFLRSRILVEKLVRSSSIGFNDLVLEIGPGQGIITQELLAVAKHVIAIEIDSRFYYFIRRKFSHCRNLTVYHADALQIKLPTASYKVFANIPFSIEGRLIRRLLHSQNPPQDSYLVVRRSLAERLGGIYQEGLFSVLHKPFFNFEIVHRFRPGDFSPATFVQPVLLRITKLEKPLISPQQFSAYRQFITRGFTGGRRLTQNLRPFFTPADLNLAASRLEFSPNSMPSALTFPQWLNLFFTWYRRNEYIYTPDLRENGGRNVIDCFVEK